MKNLGETQKQARVEMETLKGRVARLSARNVSQARMLGLVCHDVLSPVSSTAGLLGLLLKSGSENLTHHQRNIIETLERSNRRLLDFIESVSEISRIQRGKITANRSVVKARAILSECAKRFAKDATDKNIALLISNEVDAHIAVDAHRTGRALGMIIRNAIWFTPSGGKVDLSVQNEDGQVSLVVKDNGVGIEPERLAGIYETAGENFTLGTNGEKGSGLGLLHARLLAGLSGGVIEISSVPEAGTTVNMVFQETTR